MFYAAVSIEDIAAEIRNKNYPTTSSQVRLNAGLKNMKFRVSSLHKPEKYEIQKSAFTPALKNFKFQIPLLHQLEKYEFKSLPLQQP